MYRRRRSVLAAIAIVALALALVAAIAIAALFVWPGPAIRAAAKAVEATSAVEPTATVTPAVEPAAIATSVAEITATGVFSYTPGGESFGQWASDVITPAGATQPCGRIWQSTNLQNLPWTAVFCDWQTSDPAPELQWPHATQLTVSGTGIVQFELWRDSVASEQVNPDPYVAANTKKSPLGLGWFVQGFGGTACVNGECRTLSGGGVFQLGFPRDMDGHYDVQISVAEGQVQFWQGEKITSVDNWPLPAVVATD